MRLNSVREFFEGRGENLDAFLYTAEDGSAWSSLHPAYSVAIPQSDVLAVPSAYAMHSDNQKMVDFMNVWIGLKKKDRTIPTLYDY